MADSKQLFVYETSITREAIEFKLDTKLTNTEWHWIQGRMTDMIESIGANQAFGYDKLSTSLDLYRQSKGVN